MKSPAIVLWLAVLVAGVAAMPASAADVAAPAATTAPATPIAAPDAAAVAAAEIESLIRGLATSGCRFERNGDWYDGEKAAAHLRRKYDHARDRGDIADADAFIELLASRSSFSGRAYRVQCGEEAVVDSGPWFRARLSALRSAAASR